MIDRRDLLVRLDGTIILGRPALGADIGQDQIVIDAQLLQQPQHPRTARPWRVIEFQHPDILVVVQMTDTISRP